MRVVVIGIALLAGIVAGIASAGMSAAGVPGTVRATESNSVQAIRALVTRCIPGVGERQEISTAGLQRVLPDQERALLGDRPGKVWTRPGKLLLIDFADVPVCRVIALSIDPATLADLVLRVFDDGTDTFRREQFERDVSGGFAAVYAADGTASSLTVRIQTAVKTNGAAFASLNVSRTPSTD